MDKQEVINYWVTGSIDSIETATGLIKMKKYHFGLFFCQLALEKYLKSIIVDIAGESPIPTHDLIELTKRAKILPTQAQEDQLREISKFNIEARYDSIKLAFQKKSTQKYATKWYQITTELLKWLKNS